MKWICEIAFRPDSKNRIGAQHHGIEMRTNIHELCRKLRKKQVLRSTVLVYNSTIIHNMYRNRKTGVSEAAILAALHCGIEMRTNDVTWAERYCFGFALLRFVIG